MSTHGPEYKLQVKVLKALRRLPGLWCYKAHDQCTPGIPDIIGCLRGRMFAIELKAPGEGPTAIQRRTLALLRAAGASVGPAWTVEQALEIVKKADLNRVLTDLYLSI